MAGDGPGGAVKYYKKKNKKNKKSSDKGKSPVTEVDKSQHAPTFTDTKPAASAGQKKKKPNKKKIKQRERLAKHIKAAFKDSTDNTFAALAAGSSPLPERQDSPSASSTRELIDSLSLKSQDLTESMNNSDFTSSLGEDEGFEQHASVPFEDITINTKDIDRLIAQISSTSDAEMDSDDSNFDSDDEGNGVGGGKRYFAGEGSGPTCFNCGLTGHVSRDCDQQSSMPCSLCGELGHARYTCPQELCFNCHKPGHQSRECPSYRRRFHVPEGERCNRCDQPGHMAKECTLTWRSYIFSRDLPHKAHAFTDELRTLRKRCYNCASISHFGDDCPNRRRPTYATFHIPKCEHLQEMILSVKKNANNKRDDKDTSQKHSPSSSTNNLSSQQHQHQHKRTKHDNNSNTSTRQVTFQNKNNHHSSANNDTMRKVFVESRGSNDKDHSHQSHSKPRKLNQPFVKYDKNNDDGARVSVPRLVEVDEETMRKGSSSVSSSSNRKPMYRGGYRK